MPLVGGWSGHPRELGAALAYNQHRGAHPPLQVQTEKCYTYRMVRELPPFRGDIHDPACPSRWMLDLIGDRWSVLVISELACGTRRYGQLWRAIGGVSQKMLTQTLREMERGGLLSRRVFDVVPPRVGYSLTTLGCESMEPVEMLYEWGRVYANALG